MHQGCTKLLEYASWVAWLLIAGVVGKNACTTPHTAARKGGTVALAIMSKVIYENK